MIRFHGLKSCDACRRAQKALEAAGRDVEVVDVRADGVSEPELRNWLGRVGADALINRRSTTWRGLDQGARGRAGTIEGALSLLLVHPTLMKRPVIVAGDELFVGWSKETQAALL